MKNNILLAMVFAIACFSSFTIHAQWSSCNAPFGGSVTCIDQDGSFLFCGTRDNGVFRSSDNGMNWTACNNGISHLYGAEVHSMLVIPGKILIGTQTGMFTTTNQGTSWDSIGLYQATGIVQQGGFLFASVYGAVIRSTDNGVTWAPVNTGLPPLGSYVTMHLASVQNVLIVATIPLNVYKSTDNGNTWVPVTTLPNATVQNCGMLKTLGNRVFAYYGYHGLYYSDDAGLTWNSSMAANTAYTYVTDLIKVNGNYLAATPSGLSVILTGGSNYYVNANLTAPVPVLNCLGKFGGNILTGSDAEGLLEIDTLLTNYQFRNNGLLIGNMYFLSGWNNRVFGQIHRGHHLWGSTDQGSSWEVDSMFNYFYSDAIEFVKKGNKGYMSLMGGGVQLSENGGQSWRLINQGLGNPNISGMLVRSSQKILAGSFEGKIFQSLTDTTWAYWSAVDDSGDVHHLAEVGNYIYAGVRQATQGPAHLYRTSDEGANWDIVSDTWGIPYENVNGMVYDGNRLFVGTSGLGIFYTSDNGVSWHTMNAGLPMYTVFSELKTYNGAIYGTTPNTFQLFELAAGDTVWNCLNCGVNDPPATSAWKTNGIFYLGSSNSGVWKKTIPTSGIFTEVSMGSLSIFPNPGETSWLNWKTDMSEPVEIRVYNTEGKVMSIHSAVQMPYLLDEKDLPAGTYYVIATLGKEFKRAVWIKTKG